MTQFTLTQTLTFGKHKGEILEDIIKEDATYIEWYLDNIEWFELDDETEQFFEYVLADKNDGNWYDVQDETQLDLYGDR